MNPSSSVQQQRQKLRQQRQNQTKKKNNRTKPASSSSSSCSSSSCCSFEQGNPKLAKSKLDLNEIIHGRLSSLVSISIEELLFPTTLPKNSSLDNFLSTTMTRGQIRVKFRVLCVEQQWEVVHSLEDLLLSLQFAMFEALGRNATPDCYLLCVTVLAETLQVADFHSQHDLMKSEVESYVHQLMQIPSVWQNPVFIRHFDCPSGVLALHRTVMTLTEENKRLQGELAEAKQMISTKSQIILDLRNNKETKEASAKRCCFQNIFTGNPIKEVPKQENKKICWTENNVLGSSYSDPWASSKGLFMSTSGNNGFSTSLSPSGYEGGSEQHGIDQFMEPYFSDRTKPSNACVPDNDVHSPNSVDLRLRRIIDCILPHHEAECERVKVKRMICCIVKKCISAPLFMIDSSCCKMYLPDDDLELSAFICQGQESNWFLKVNEALCIASSKFATECNSSVKNGGDSVTCDESFVIENVKLLNSSPQRVTCSVNNIHVEISVNQVPKIACAGFLCEVNELIGKDDLFKRSILLIRAWFSYDSGTYYPDKNHGYPSLTATMSTYTTSVLVIALFNLFAEELHHPFQVLVKYFEFYKSFDWERYCISIEGPRELSNLTKEPAQSSNAVVGFNLVNKYRMNPSKNSDRDGEMLPVFSEEDITRMIFAFPVCLKKIVDLELNMFVLDIHDEYYGSFKPAEQLRIRSQLPQVVIFYRVRKTLDIASSRFRPILQALKKESNHAATTRMNSTTSVCLVENVFLNTWKRFGYGWRPDCSSRVTHKGNDDLVQILSSICSDRKTSKFLCDQKPSVKLEAVVSVDLEQIWKDLKYCSLLLHSEINSTALLSMTTEYLTQFLPKGVPIGEIGKGLKEITANPSLCSILKDKFGGLKKFIELYPDIFFIANDHPYNPKVYLQNELSQEQKQTMLNKTSLGVKKKQCRRKKGGNCGSDDNSKDDLCVLAKQVKTMPKEDLRSCSLDTARCNSKPSLSNKASVFIPASCRSNE